METQGQSYTAALWPHSRKHRLGTMGEIQLWSILEMKNTTTFVTLRLCCFFPHHLKLSGEQQGWQGFAENL